MIDHPPILVTGIARSGTSMIAAVINTCGAFGGVMSVNNNKRRGMFENIQIRDSIVKPYMDRIGVDREGQYPLPSTPSVSIPMDWRTRVEKVMVDEGYQGGEWMYKDTRSGLIWPVWHYAFPDAKWVIVRRRSADVIQSCSKTGFMRAFKNENILREIGLDSPEAGWSWWIRQHEKKFVEMISEGVNCKVIWPERILEGNLNQLHEILEWLGLSWKQEALDFINPLLWTKKKGGK